MNLSINSFVDCSASRRSSLHEFKRKALDELGDLVMVPNQDRKEMREKRR